MDSILGGRWELKKWHFLSVGLIPLIALLIFGSAIQTAEAQRDDFQFEEIILSQEDPVGEISWRPDGSLIALAAGNNIQIYTSDLQEWASLEGHTDQVVSIDWSPDGNKLVSGSLDTTIRIWDVQTVNDLEKAPSFGTTLETWDCGSRVLRVVWSPDGTKIASRSSDNTIEGIPEVGGFTSTWIWDVASGEVLRQLPSLAGSQALTWSRDSLQIVNAGRTSTTGYAVMSWDISSGDSLYGLPYQEFYTRDVEWSPNGEYLAVASAGLWVDVADGIEHNVFLTLDTIDTPISLSWTPDSTKLALGDETGTLIVWDRATGQRLVEILGAHTGYIREVEWSADGTHLASIGSGDKTLRIWDLADLPDPQGTATATPNYPTATPSPEITLTPISTPIVSNAEIAYSRTLSNSDSLNQRLMFRRSEMR